jgi:hypothetical protein
MKKNVTIGTLCRRFLRWAAKHHPDSVVRYRQFLGDFVAHRIKHPKCYAGPCGTHTLELAGLCLANWMGAYGIEEVHDITPLAQSFALDAGMQMLDWARGTGYHVAYYQLPAHDKGEITSSLSGLMVRFDVPAGHKYLYREVTQLKPWMERVVELLPGEVWKPIPQNWAEVIATKNQARRS